MAQATTRTVFSAAVGALAGAAAMLTPVSGTAQEVAMADQVEPAGHSISPEIAELNAATVAAHNYSVDNIGVGVLIHIGQDIPNEHFATPEQFGQTVVGVFKQKYGTDSQYFLSQNDAPATVMEYFVDGNVHGADTGTELKPVGTAFEVMPEVAGLLRELKADELAQADTGNLVPQPGG